MSISDSAWKVVLTCRVFWCASVATQEMRLCWNFPTVWSAAPKQKRFAQSCKCRDIHHDLRPRASVRFADAQSGDNGNDAGQGEQEGEDIVGNSEGGAAEGTLHRKYSSSSQGSNKSIKTISNHRI